MDLQDLLIIDEAQRARLDDVRRRYRLLYNDPEHCRPMFIVRTPVPPGSEKPATWEKMLADPLVMLRSELAIAGRHLAIGDDRLPVVRVNFGTPQVAAAFGCRIVFPENNQPAAGSHVLEQASDVRTLAMPSLDAGWYGRLAEWTRIWQQHLPDGVPIQHPDIQSAFNSAHLIRGNDILTDFFDAPDAVDALLDKVTDYMIAITRHTKAMISDDPDWFYDWGSSWKGFARISNCSMQMISPDLYRQHVLPRDRRFFDAVGGGRIHYCGITGSVIDDFFSIPNLSGIDFDHTRHDFYGVCARAPQQVVVTITGSFGRDSKEIQRMLAGDWPAKRNLIIPIWAPTVEEGKRLLEALRRSMPGRQET